MYRDCGANPLHSPNNVCLTLTAIGETLSWKARGCALTNDFEMWVKIPLGESNTAYLTLTADWKQSRGEQEEMAHI